MRKLMATTALATLLVSGAYAQDAAAPAPAAPTMEQSAPAKTVMLDKGSLVTNIIGESVYNGTADDAQSIGKVSDVILDNAGKAKSLVIGVGGFLGVGDKKVAYDFSKLTWAEKGKDRWLVADTTKEALQAEPEFDPTPYQPAGTGEAAADRTMEPNDGTAPAGTMAPSSDTAQSTPAPATAGRVEGNLASQIIGENVYDGTGDNAQKIGDVNDIVLDKDNQAQSLVIGVGGFLGMGEKNVAFDYGKAQWATKNGDRWLVVEATKEQLKQLPDFDRKAFDPDGMAAAMSTETSQAAPSGDTGTGMAMNGTAGVEAHTDETKTAAVDKSTLTEMPIGDIRSQDLVGTTVYGADDAKIGQIGDVALSADQKVDAVILDVGGFLGVGAKEVAVAMDHLKFMVDKDGKKYLYTSLTKDQLEKQAAYDKGSYTDKRDEQRMMVQ